VTIETLHEAVEEAKRFLERAEALQGAYLAQKTSYEAKPNPFAADLGTGFSNHPVETGAVRRASMDLTRALARLRKHGV
jgi:hypothetical protein